MKKGASFKMLKLAANDVEDLGIISAITQDALIHAEGMDYDPMGKKFHMVANRFCWEHLLEEVPTLQDLNRIHTGISFDHVEKAEYKGFDRTQKKKPLSLLTIQFTKPYVHLLFSDHQEIRLKVKKVNAKLRDLNNHWPADQAPWHPEIDEVE
jgi:hypothetical protein